MEIIIGSVAGAFILALLILRSVLNTTIKDFIEHIEKADRQNADERAELTKLIKAESLTDFEMNARIPAQPPRKLTPEELKIQEDWLKVGTIDDSDLTGQVQYK